MWYDCQVFYIRWGSYYTDGFSVTNGVKQGGILSPYLFNLYMNDLSEQLNKLSYGCYVHGYLLNHLVYADDISLMCPPAKGLNKLLQCCEKYATLHDINFNAKKTKLILARSRSHKDLLFPSIYFQGDILNPVDNAIYLGHIISDDLHDDLDI